MVMNLGGNQFNTKKAPIWSFCFFLVDSCAWIKKLNLKNLSWMSQVPWIFTNKLGCVLKLVNVFYYSKLWDPIGIHHHEFHPPICFTTFPSTQKNHKSHPQTGHHRPKRRPRFAFAMAKMIKPKRPNGFLKSFFFKDFFGFIDITTWVIFQWTSTIFNDFLPNSSLLGLFCCFILLDKRGKWKRANMF